MESNTDPSADQKPKVSVSNTVDYIKELLTAGPQSATGRGLELGVGAVLARTALKRLPAPLNFVVPMVVEKVILKHGVDEGRDLLLKGLRWVKKATDEKPEVLS
ncbi:hypothetical protein DYBT9623_01211 [Dyadobacter sp. CECT 9623]|uniref:Uncharacterized protein n=1 Tax=Dyadobacter linearis TaxID=2823330 RepID=A0ABM8UM73_9BACT|nr:hypothetical protein [Dyadobacter sp. CECT 9623]CAG5068480.1 hypothetical protein DYBT9623_01211 [Dyadobacter sp. CECT 9623]